MVIKNEVPNLGTKFLPYSLRPAGLTPITPETFAMVVLSVPSSMEPNEELISVLFSFNHPVRLSRKMREIKWNNKHPIVIICSIGSLICNN